MNYIIIYFSGTGNTKALAERLGKNLKIKAHSIEEDLNWPQYISSAEKVIILYPIHMSLPPIIMRRFLAKYADSFENKEIISIISQMCYSGDGARVVEDFLPESAQVIDTHHINMPNNISNIPFLPLASEDGNRRKTKRGLKKIDKIAKLIAAGKFKRRHCSKFFRKLGSVQHPDGVISQEKNMDSVSVSDDCISCGLCAKLCPSDNFLVAEKAQPQGQCTLCLRCENKCPRKAIRVLIDQPVKKVYPGPIIDK